MTDTQQMNLDSAVRLAASRAGLNTYTDASGHSLVDLTSASYDQSRNYLVQLKTIIETYPDRFATQTVAAANTATDAGPLQDYTLSDAAGTIADSVAQTAQTINPFSTTNIYWLFAAAFALLVLFVFLKTPRGKAPADPEAEAPAAPKPRRKFSPLPP